MALEGYIKRVIRVEIPTVELSKDATSVLVVSTQKIYPETVISETFIIEDDKTHLIVAKEKVVYDGKGHRFITDGRPLIGEL